LTKCLQSVYPKHSTAARMHQAETNTRGLSFSMKKPASLFTALRRVRAFVARAFRGITWSTNSIARNSLSFDLTTNNSVGRVNLSRSNMDYKHAALRLAKILNAPATIHKACSVMTWQSQHCRPYGSKCAKFDRQKCNKSFRELHMVTRARATQST